MIKILICEDDLKDRKILIEYLCSYFKANKIQIETDEEVAWTIDGEFAGRLKNVDIQNCNKALELAVCENIK